MKRWFELFFKAYIDELVDKRFTENMIERYWAQKRNETARRLQKARERHKMDSPESYEKPAEKDHVVLSSANVRWEDAKSKVQAKTTSSSLKDKLKRLDNAK